MRHAASAILLLLTALAIGQSSPSRQPQAAASATPVHRPNIPEKFTNLQVLPADITRPELLPIMKGFCKTFNVRCAHCHVATDDLSEANFPDDSKPTKLQARELLRAIRATLKAQRQPPK